VKRRKEKNMRLINEEKVVVYLDDVPIDGPWVIYCSADARRKSKLVFG
jgi:hypothetical protein